LYTALEGGFPPERIYFHGNNKSLAELELALEHRVGCIVIDNFPEIEMVDQLAAQIGHKQEVMLRITPGVDTDTHAFIQTGQMDSKFGFTLGQGVLAVRRVLEKENLLLRGLHCHIGSQIFNLDSYGLALEIMFNLLLELREKLGWTASELDMGGGLGIRYQREDQPVTPEDYIAYLGKAARQLAAKMGLTLPRISVEPGRSIIGPAGITLYTIGSIKELPGIRKYVAVDGGMVDNPRVALYGAIYEGVVANKAGESSREVVSIAGKCCESGDMLIWDLEVPPVEQGDLLAVFATGAYNYSMASNYNRLPRPAGVFVYQGRSDLVIRRENYADLVSHDVLPDRFRVAKRG
ncbi:MAG: diaminopimelate decarboxylase, partial [Limnochordia bacterium]